ncbi:MAG: EamA family transporter [Planctomycetota bacterium]
MSQRSDFLKLHLVIFLWGLTAAIGKEIDLSATQLVLIRSFLAAGLLSVLLDSRARISPKLALALAANGALLGLHWVLFFLAVKIANVSICMVGMATVSFWTALLEPLMIRKRRFKWVQFALGAVVIGGVYLIYQTESQFHTGIFVALMAAIAATVFSIINGQLSHRADDDVIVMYEMAGSAAFCGSAILVAPLFATDLSSDRWWLTLEEWGWLTFLVVVCTVFAYRLYVSLLERLSVYTINFANNLEPIYGIVIGAIFYHDHANVGWGFYTGTAAIVAAVILQPRLARDESQANASEEATSGA